MFSLEGEDEKMSWGFNFVLSIKTLGQTTLPSLDDGKAKGMATVSVSISRSQ